MNGTLKANDRVIVLGSTGSGKSELINVLFSEVRCQRALVDTKEEFTIPDVEPVRDPAAINWDEPIIHYRDAGGGPDEFGELFERFYARRRLVVCVHELADLCDNHAGLTPVGVKKYIKKGRAHGLGLIGGSQRPVEMPRAARTEVQHVFYFPPRLDADDHATVRGMVEPRGADLDGELTATESLGTHELPTNGPGSFLWYDKGARAFWRSPPLPAELRARSIVGRVTIA